MAGRLGGRIKFDQDGNDECRGVANYTKESLPGVCGWFEMSVPSYMYRLNDGEGNEHVVA